MARIVQIGGGVVGLCNAMLLARDGHEVTVLERDPALPPPPDQAWESWDRRGVNQMRMLHFFNPRFTATARTELPAVVDAMLAAGAFDWDVLADLPDAFTGGRRPGDELFAAVTARRPIGEAVIAMVASETPGLTIRRGVAVAGLVARDRSAGAVPDVVGVRTEQGDDVLADVVVDASGRRSPLPRFLDAIGAPPLCEHAEESGFVYFGRHYRGDAMPAMVGGALQSHGTYSTLTLPADNGTWAVGIVATAKDRALLGLRDCARWEAVVRACPLVAHWLEGSPVEDAISVMAKLEDRIRSLVVDGEPVVTGVLPVADAWACTNPSLGRGMAIGLLHAVGLRDLLREADVADRRGLAMAWESMTDRVARPWYDETLRFDRHRLAEIDSLLDGRPYEVDDEWWEFQQALRAGLASDPDVFRAFLSEVGLVGEPDAAFDDPELRKKVLAVGGDWRNAPQFGPDRDELVDLVSA